MTRQQMATLVALALAVVCVLCLGVYVLIMEESKSYLQPMWTPGATATRKPTATPRPEHDEIDARSACEKFVRDRLVVPSTAKFDHGSERAVHYGGGKYSVTGQFEAQNKFGVMIRSLYVCDVHYDGMTDKWYLDDISIIE